MRKHRNLDCDICCLTLLVFVCVVLCKNGSGQLVNMSICPHNLFGRFLKCCICYQDTGFTVLQTILLPVALHLRLPVTHTHTQTHTHSFLRGTWFFVVSSLSALLDVFWLTSISGPVSSKRQGTGQHNTAVTGKSARVHQRPHKWATTHKASGFGR